MINLSAITSILNLPEVTTARLCSLYLLSPISIPLPFGLSYSLVTSRFSEIFPCNSSIGFLQCFSPVILLLLTFTNKPFTYFILSIIWFLSLSSGLFALCQHFSDYFRFFRVFHNFVNILFFIHFSDYCLISSSSPKSQNSSNLTL